MLLLRTQGYVVIHVVIHVVMHVHVVSLTWTHMGASLGKTWGVISNLIPHTQTVILGGFIGKYSVLKEGDFCN